MPMNPRDIPSLAAIYGDRLQSDRDAWQVAEQQAAVEGHGDASRVWLRWRQAAYDAEQRAQGGRALSLQQQAQANARVHRIAQQAKAEQAKAEQRDPAAAFQQAYYDRHGVWPSRDEQRAAGVIS
jgi:hypothetical protein